MVSVGGSNSGDLNRGVILDRSSYRADDLTGNTFAGHSRKLQGGRSLTHLEIRRGVSARLQDLQPVVDDHTRRTIPGKHYAIRRALEFHIAPGFRFGT